MAIISCPKCKQRISSLSVQCIYCQQPIKGHLREDGRPGRVSRKSSNNWLVFFSLITTLIFIIGTALFIRDQGRGLSPYQSPFALGLMIIGFAGYLLARVMVWVKKFK